MATTKHGVSEGEFRKLALSMPEAVEGEHMDHPDFRCNGRIFATLQPKRGLGMVKVTPAEQRRLMREHADGFSTCNGAWGRAGCTWVHLDAVPMAALRPAMTMAWELVMAQPKSKARRKKAR
jgi:hypothetical protein